MPLRHEARHALSRTTSLSGNWPKPSLLLCRNDFLSAQLGTAHDNAAAKYFPGVPKLCRRIRDRACPYPRSILPPPALASLEIHSAIRPTFLLNVGSGQPEISMGAQRPEGDAVMPGPEYVNGAAIAKRGGKMHKEGGPYEFAQRDLEAGWRPTP